MDTPLFLHIGERDEITDVLSLIEKATDECVYIVCPQKSLLLMSIVNVKLLKRWAEKYKKTLAVITHDRVIRNIVAQAGIATFKDKNEVARVRVLDKEKEEALIQAIPKKSSKVMAFLQEKFPMLFQDKREKVQLVFIKPSQRAFLALLFLGIGVFVVVAFFALPDATITITPTQNTLPIQTNVTLSYGPTSLEEKVVHMEPIDVEFERVLFEPVTGQTEKGTRARGRVKLLNNAQKPWPLLGNSRLQTKDGLVFLTTKFVTIPGKTEQGAGELLVEVEARDVDANNQPIGKRGNIGPTTFFMPGLSAQNQKLISGISEEAFSGGESKVEVFVTKEDIDRANKNILQELKNHAPEELSKKLSGKFEESVKTDHMYDIFQVHDDRFVKTELLSVVIPQNILGQKRETIEVHGKMRAHAYYYDIHDFYSIMESYVKTHQLTNREKLLMVDAKSLQFINIFPFQDNAVKVTAKMNAMTTFSFDREDDALKRQMRDMITGVSLDSAKSYIQNLPEVDEVDISLFPFWQKTIPTIKENIHIIVKM